MDERNETPGEARAVALFSGGLDSILAARLLVEQGLTVQCLHFVTPFFGKPQLIPHWEAIYGLKIEAVDVGADFTRLLRRFPEHGYGKVMNPCVDCKILMMRKARERMSALGAQCIVSGEVLGQRPMSQRRDTLNIIAREAGVSGLLLRPLCARHLPPTNAERAGLVDRSRLGAISGRGRREQLEMAARMGLAEIPTPAGGCRLAEKENARRYWPVLTRLADPAPEDFALANVGRQFWRDDAWLIMGRNEADNSTLADFVGQTSPAGPPAFGPDAVMLSLATLPGPLALLRLTAENARAAWREGAREFPALLEAAALLASYAPRAGSGETAVHCRPVAGGPAWEVRARPSRETGFVSGGASFEDVKAELRAHQG